MLPRPLHSHMARLPLTASGPRVPTGWMHAIRPLLLLPWARCRGQRTTTRGACRLRPRGLPTGKARTCSCSCCCRSPRAPVRYAVAYSHQLQADELFATRLWGEPLVLYRDEDGEVVCVRDVCPHRSAPLSMGDVKDGVLRCFYHGWGYGADGKCVSVPTMGSDASKSPSGSDCNNFATVELDGMLWVWRGHVLSADATKLPRWAAHVAACHV